MKPLNLLRTAALLLTIAAATPGVTAQKMMSDPPDMAKIKAETTNPRSRYYYPKLFERYQRNETIMDLTDYRYLYLGAVYQEDFNPYRQSTPISSRAAELYQQKDFTRADFDSIIHYAQLALDNDPFDLRQMSYMIYALQGKQRIHSAKIWQYRLKHLLEAILSTGSGSDTQNAWVVINPRHEYDILNLKNAVVKEAKFVEPFYEYIEVESPQGQTNGYYFNLRYLLDEYYRKHPEQLQEQQ